MNKKFVDMSIIYKVMSIISKYDLNINKIYTKQYMYQMSKTLYTTATTCIICRERHILPYIEISHIGEYSLNYSDIIYDYFKLDADGSIDEKTLLMGAIKSELDSFLVQKKNVSDSIWSSYK